GVGEHLVDFRVGDARGVEAVDVGGGVNLRIHGGVGAQRDAEVGDGIAAAQNVGQVGVFLHGLNLQVDAYLRHVVLHALRGGLGLALHDLELIGVKARAAGISGLGQKLLG